MDYERLASELIRALRGSRSQVAFSRRLGSRGNVVASWEGGRRFPTASKTLRVAERAGIDVVAALHRFYQSPPAWLPEVRPATTEGVARLLQDLRGAAAISDVAVRAQRSRYAVSRWLRGLAEPRLPDFLRMIEATSLRLLDFLATWVDPERLPSAAAAYRRLVASRQAAYEVPWSHAVLRVLETEAYRALPHHEPGWIARRLGIPVEEEARCLEVLRASHQIAWRKGRWRPTRVLSVDIREDPEAARRLKAFWAQVALDRLVQGAPGLFSYNLFTVSEADRRQLEDLHRAYYRQLRAIVAQSTPGEHVVLANVQLLGFDGP
jgi:transcriptional regulator with XRE-family HTH domain